MFENTSLSTYKSEILILIPVLFAYKSNSRPICIPELTSLPEQMRVNHLLVSCSEVVCWGENAENRNDSHDESGNEKRRDVPLRMTLHCHLKTIIVL